MATFALTVALSWALGIVMHWWPRLPARWRRWVSLATSAAAIAFLVAGTAAEGFRETATTSTLVLGPAYVTSTASASASLHYYVLTAVCLLLGFAGLAFGETLSRWLSGRWVLSAAAVAWLITAVRFLLERTASPPSSPRRSASPGWPRWPAPSSPPFSTRRAASSAPSSALS